MQIPAQPGHVKPLGALVTEHSPLPVQTPGASTDWQRSSPTSAVQGTPGFDLQVVPTH